MLLAALVLSLPATVDYTTVAKPLPVVLRELSEIAGETWRSANALDSELLVVRVEDVSVEELRKRIADAVVGKWWFESDAWVLKPDSATLRKRAEGLRKSYADQFAKAAAENYNDVVAERRAPSEAELLKAAEEGETADVASTMLAHALRQVNYDEVAGLPEDVKLVYSTASNRRQRPLRGLNRLLQESLVLQHRFAEAASHADIDEPEVGTYEYMLRQDSLRKWAGPIKAVLSVAWSVGAFFAKCHVIDATGKVVDEARFSFSYEHEQLIEVPAVLAESEPKFSLDTIAFEEFFDTGTETLLETFNPRFLARLQRPTISDPLSFTVSDSLLEIGRLCTLNVVARPYDDFYYGDPLERGKNLADWLAGIERDPVAHISLGDGWLIIGPSGFRMTPQIDRRALETLLDQSRIRLPTLPEVSAYAVVTTDSLLELVYITPFAGFYPEWTWYKLYGKLPEEARAALWRGEPVPVGRLPANARDFVEWILDNEISSPTHDDAVFDFDRLSLPISEWLPNGLPPDLLLLPEVQGDPCFLLTKPRSLRARSVVRSLDDMGQYAANRHFAGMSDSLTFPRYLGPVRIGSSRGLTLKLVIGAEAYEDTLVDVDLSRRSKVYAGPDLPDEVQKRFEAAASRHLKRLRDGGGDAGGGE